MQFNIQGRNMEVGDTAREYVERKIGRLDHYLPTLTEARVEIGEERSRNTNRRYVVQVTLYESHGTILRAEERAQDIPPAVDAVVEKMHRQILRFKGKRKDRYQRAATDESWDEVPPAEAEEDDEEASAEVVRVKRFALSPMNSDEAIEQMELLGHTFFVYYDADQAAINVVYRRRDGTYGLIIPELA